MDQVSAAIAAVLGTHALEYQTVSAQVADFHAQFVGALNSGASQYLSTEAANAEQSLLNAVNSPAQGLLGHSAMGTGTGTSGAVGGTGSPAVAAGGVPAVGTGETEPVSFPVLNTDSPLAPVKLTFAGTAGLATGAVSVTSGSLVVPSGASLGAEAIGPYLTTASALQGSSTAVGNVLSGGRAVAAVNPLVHTPGNAVKTFVSGQETTSHSTAAPADSGSASSRVNIPVAGLLGPASEGEADP
jgi:hypothetical protein